jgi:hypothetical protein
MRHSNCRKTISAFRPNVNETLLNITETNYAYNVASRNALDVQWKYMIMGTALLMVQLFTMRVFGIDK